VVYSEDKLRNTLGCDNNGKPIGNGIWDVNWSRA